MTRRERFLAIAVGGLVVLLVVWYVFSSVSGSLAARYQQLRTLEGQLQQKQRTVRQGQLASRRMAEFETQSLPRNLEKAQSLYQTWLLELVQKHGVRNSNVSAIAGRQARGIYHQFGFSIKGQMTLPELTRMLHDFYSYERLQRIRRLRVKPIDNSSELDVDILIEALALTTAPDSEKLTQEPKERHAFGTGDKYVKTISERNIFAPPHQPPRVTSTASSRYTLGSTVSFTIKGEDPEKRPVTYALESASMKGATLDPKTGEFRWRAESKGDYEITVRATDGGVPAKSTTKTIKFAVVDPPPPPPPPQPRPKFDVARFTYLTAVLDIDGEAEAWLVVRTTGELLKLRAGERIELGDLSGTLDEIGEYDIIIETESGDRWLVTVGDSLRDAYLLTAEEGI